MRLEASAMRLASVFLPCLLASHAIAQSVWSQIQPAQFPGPRREHAMAFDAARGVTVFFGGYSNAFQNDTWTFDGTNWQLVPVPGARPSPRGRAGMCYDSARQQIVLVGGQGWNDTWTWNGAVWANSGTYSIPQTQQAVAFDSVRNVVVAHDGQYTHEWSGTGDWVRRQPAHTHLGDCGALVFDAAAGKSLLFADGQTWHWDGVDWLQQNPPNSPPSRVLHRMVYEINTGKAVMFGGYTGVELNDTWAWDGTTWTQQIAAGAPPIRHSHGMAFDAVNQRTVLYGGTYGRSDTWLKNATFAAPATVTAFGSGCAGSVAVPQLSAVTGSLPWIGATLQVDLHNLPWLVFRAPFGVLGFSNTVWNGNPLPVSLAPVGMPGCQAFVSVDQIEPLVNSFGSARWQIPIPYAAWLVGVDLHLQGLLVDPSVNAFGAVVSNALACRIGAR